MSKLNLISEREVAGVASGAPPSSGTAAGPQASSEHALAASRALSLILLALKALSQRTVVALSNCVTLLSVASAFYLWTLVLPNPTPTQLAGLGLYGVLLIALRYVWRA